jgi:hypothetical protein
MADNKVPKVFVSYSRRDAQYAERILKGLLEENAARIWVDTQSMEAGQSISAEITEAIKSVDYYLLLISENSNSSTWVQREISLAFELAKDSNLAIIPFLLSRVDVPLEFKGLVYIDGTRSFEEGVDQLITFLKRQTTKVRELTRSQGKSIPRQDQHEQQKQEQQQQQQQGGGCFEALGALEIGELRYRLSASLTLKDIRVLWFDVFYTKMEDDVNAQDRATCCLELLDRSSREDRLPKLLVTVCRNHPAISN